MFGECIKFDLKIDCPQKWDSMNGDDKIRHCGMCKKNIHNLEEFDEEEAHAIIADGNNCVRMEPNHRGYIKTSSGFSKSLLLMGLAIGCGDSSNENKNTVNPDKTQIENSMETKGSQVESEQKETNEVNETKTRPHIVGRVAPKKDKNKPNDEKGKSGSP